MPADSPHDALETLTVELTKTEDTLANLIAFVIPGITRENDERFAAINKRIDELDVGTSSALSREHYTSATERAAITADVRQTDAYVHSMRQGLETTISDHLAALKSRVVKLETRLS